MAVSPGAPRCFSVIGAKLRVRKPHVPCALRLPSFTDPSVTQGHGRLLAGEIHVHQVRREGNGQYLSRTAVFSVFISDNQRVLKVLKGSEMKARPFLFELREV